MRERHMAMLLIFALFFSMQSHEFVTTSSPKISATVKLRHIVCLSDWGGTINQRSLAINDAHSVSVIFENKKSKVKWEPIEGIA